MKIKKIIGTVKDYDWGNKDFIPSLIGGYTGKPQAELWFGTHRLGESTLEDGSLLSELIKEDRSYLGADYDAFSGELPILLKILAIEKPLSLQCHPTRKQAEEGWRNEEARRERGEECNYQDPNPKAEVIAALSPITALCGFRDIEVVNADLAALVPASYARFLRSLGKSVKELYLGLYGLSSDDRAFLLDELGKSLEADRGERWNGLFLTRKGIAVECLSEYPGDIGAVFPYLMNVVTLQIGEALFLEPDTLHAYVYGNGVELMNASDNVLRGGLTRKRMDLRELERIMSFTSIDPEKSRTEKDGYGRTSYCLGTDEFRLLSASDGSYSISGDSLSLVLSVDGAVRFSEGGGSLTIGKGECAVVPSGLQYTMNVRGRAYIAQVGTKWTM